MHYYEAWSKKEVVAFVKLTLPDVYRFYTRVDIDTLKTIYGCEYLKET